MAELKPQAKVSSTQRELAMFLLVGGAIAVWYGAWIAVLHHGLKLSYPAAVSVSYVVAVTSHFFVNKALTFKTRAGQTAQQLRRYIVFLIAHYSFTLAVVTFGVEVMAWPVMLASAAAIVLATGFGFVANKYWVFAS